jgi:hypothetical protein
LENDVDIVLQGMALPDQTGHADFRIVKIGYLIGSSSFALISLCWLALWRILSRERKFTSRSFPRERAARG